MMKVQGVVYAYTVAVKYTNHIVHAQTMQGYNIIYMYHFHNSDQRKVSACIPHIALAQAIYALHSSSNEIYALL